MSAKVDEKYKVKGYYPTIGIECHVQLRTKTKLFGSASNESIGAKQNTLVDQVCFGLPGALPVLNQNAVELASKAAFALRTKPQKFSKFDRKHYFYPDLPKGYQISQFDEPIIIGGSIPIKLEDGSEKIINVTRAHLEEDAGKSTHPSGADYSLVDLNRAGTPLLEIVSEPEIHNAEEAKAYAKELWIRMKFADVSDVDLYHGNMRFDVNVSVSKDPENFGIRSETKNLNSFKSVERAVNFEIERQIKLLDKGGEVVQETRGWLDDEQKTVSQRSKEDAHDYRYFPDPDIPPIQLDDEFINRLSSEMPQMPDAWREKLSELNVPGESIEDLLSAQAEFSSNFLNLFNNCKAEHAKNFSNWIINIEIPLRRELKEKTEDLEIEDELRLKLFSSVEKLVESGKLSSNNAKNIIVELLCTQDLPEDLEKYAEDNGYVQMSDDSVIEEIVKKIIDENPRAVEDIKAGNDKVIGFLVGQVMKESKGKANPGMAQQIIKNLLGV